MRKTQAGASYLSIFLGVLVFAFIVKAVLAVWPAYWDDRVINSQIEEVLKKNSINMTASQFSSQMNQSLSMNGIRDFNFDDIARVTNEQGLKVTKQYEVRKPFLLNISLVLTFEKGFDQRSVQSK